MIERKNFAQGLILRTFAVFAKHWEPGRVKTRLAKKIGAQNASRIYFQFLKLTLEIASNLKFPGTQKVIGFTPDDRQAEFARLAPEWKQFPQSGEDLGSRMKGLFDRLFHTCLNNTHDNIETRDPETQSHKIILIGSDTPLLPPATIELAFAELEQTEIVLGPSPDGGYYLVGARSKTPLIFDDVNWSSDQVLSETIRNIKHRGYSYKLLEEHSDIDQVDDLQQLFVELKQKHGCSTLESELFQIVESALKEVDLVPGNGPSHHQDREPL